MKTTRRRPFRLLAGILMLPLLLAFASCLKEDTDYVIKSANEIEVTARTGIDATAFSMAGSELPTNDPCELMEFKGKDGVETKDVSDDSYKTCEVKVTIDPKDAENKSEEIGIGRFDVTIDGDKATFHRGMTSDELSEVKDRGVDISDSPSKIYSSFRVSVTFPGKVESASGSGKIDGNKVTWTDPADILGSEGLVAKGSLTKSSGSLTIIIIVVVIAVLAIAGVAAFLLLRKKQSKNSQPTTSGMSPENFGQPVVTGANGAFGASGPYAQQVPGAPVGQPPYQQPGAEGYGEYSQQGMGQPSNYAGTGYSATADPSQGDSPDVSFAQGETPAVQDGPSEVPGGESPANGSTPGGDDGVTGAAESSPK